MSNDCHCSRCQALERVRFFPRQLVTAEDLNDQQEYFRARLRRHNVYLHGFGIVCGLGVTLPSTGFVIEVAPGYAITPQGDEVQVTEAFRWDLRPEILATFSCPPTSMAGLDGLKLYVGVRPSDCATRAVRVAADRCSCDDGRCEFTRIRESYERCFSTSRPEAYVDRDARLGGWKEQVAKNKSLIAPPCPTCPEDDCVLLAEITVQGGALSQANIRPLLIPGYQVSLGATGFFS